MPNCSLHAMKFEYLKGLEVSSTKISWIKSCGYEIKEAYQIINEDGIASMRKSLILCKASIVKDVHVLLQASEAIMYSITSLKLT